MVYRGRERRKYPRYNMETKVHFHIDFVLKTRVKFLIEGERKAAAKKHIGISRNISAEGLRFSSNEKLNEGNRLYIQLYLPRRKRSIHMTGKVVWSRRMSVRPKDKYHFDTGIKLLTVKGKSVARSVHIDKKYGIPWSIVLESVFGSFSKSLHRHVSKT